jgi:hypothetical protein
MLPKHKTMDVFKPVKILFKNYTKPIQSKPKTISEKKLITPSKKTSLPTFTESVRASSVFIQAGFIKKAEPKLYNMTEMYILHDLE